MIKAIVEKLLDQKDLTRTESVALMRSMMSGELGQAKAVAVLTALRLKGETVEEIAGFVTAMREKVIQVKPTREGVVDTCGTGGDAQHTFNISTTTAIVCAVAVLPWSARPMWSEEPPESEGAVAIPVQDEPRGLEGVVADNAGSLTTRLSTVSGELVIRRFGPSIRYRINKVPTISQELELRVSAAGMRTPSSSLPTPALSSPKAFG